MTNLDQFESEFRSATRTPFQYEPVRVQRVLLVTDLAQPHEPMQVAVQNFLHVRQQESDAPEIEVVLKSDWTDVRNLLELVEQRSPDMLVTYRNLSGDAWHWPHSLGESVDVLAQVTDLPVLLIPHPKEHPDFAQRLENTDSVMAITDHLTGDHRLVNYAAAMTQLGGKLVLTHVEDQAAFDRVIDAISKIPMIDTETAREALALQLLKDPQDYIESCQQVLQAAHAQIEMVANVSMGHRLKDHLHLVEDHKIDLLVLNTKDDDQMAMHGLAYPLAVQLRRTALLML